MSKTVLYFLDQKFLGKLILFTGLIVVSTMATAKGFVPMPQFWSNEQPCSEYKVKPNTYQDADADSHQEYLQFFPAGKAIQRQDNGNVETFKYRVTKVKPIKIHLFNGNSYTLSAKGELIEENGKIMTLASQNPVSACWASQIPPIPDEWAKQKTFPDNTYLNACLQGQTDMDACSLAVSASGIVDEDAIAIYQRGCVTHQSWYACIFWVRAVANAAEIINDIQAAVPIDETQLDQKNSLLQIFASSFIETQTTPKKWVISDSVRHQWEKSCETMVSWKLCSEIAGVLWVNYPTPTQSIKILHSACQRQLTMDKTCEIYAQLANDPQFMQATFQPVTQLPCGKVKPLLPPSEMGFINSYIFSNGGMVKYDEDDSNYVKQARLKDGDIYISSSEWTDDSVLRSFGSWLIGDKLLEIRTYSPETQRTCTPPIAY